MKERPKIKELDPQQFVSARFTPENVREWLQHAPPEPGPQAANLKGFVIHHDFFCIRCCGRLSASGIILPRESSPVWQDRNPEMAVCAACGNIAKAKT